MADWQSVSKKGKKSTPSKPSPTPALASTFPCLSPSPPSSAPSLTPATQPPPPSPTPPTTAQPPSPPPSPPSTSPIPPAPPPAILSPSSPSFTPSSSSSSLSSSSSSSSSSPSPSSSSSSSLSYPRDDRYVDELNRHLHLCRHIERLQNLIEHQSFQISELENNVLRLTEKIEAVEAENNFLQSRLTTTVCQKDPPEDLSEKISSLEAQIEHSTKSWAEKSTALEKQVQQSAKSWAEVVKSSTQVVSDSLLEHQRREAKALNIRVRGVSFDAKDLLAEARAFISSTFGEKEEAIVAAWKGKLHPSTIFMRFKDATLRQSVLRKRGCLRGSSHFVDEDLTPLQWQERKQLFEKAKEKGQHVLFRDGRPVFVKARLPLDSQLSSPK